MDDYEGPDVDGYEGGEWEGTLDGHNKWEDILASEGLSAELPDESSDIGYVDNSLPDAEAAYSSIEASQKGKAAEMIKDAIMNPGSYAEFLDNGEVPAEFGGESAYTKQLVRVSGVPYGVAATIADLIENPSLYGHKINSKNLNAKSAKDAVANFGELIGKDPRRFAKDIRRSLDSSVVPSTSMQDIRTAFSMIGITATNYDQFGSPMLGQHANSEKQVEADEELAWAKGYIEEFVAKGVNPELAGKNRVFAQAKASKELTKYLLYASNKPVRLIDANTGLVQRDSKGNSIYASTVVPTLRELGSEGLRRDRTKTGYTRTQYTELFPTFERDDNGIEKFDEDLYANSPAGAFKQDGSGKSVLTYYQPSARQDWFPTSVYGEEESARLFGEAKDNLKKVRQILRRESDSFRSAEQDLEFAGERLDREDRLNEGYLMDLADGPKSRAGSNAEDSDILFGQQVELDRYLAGEEEEVIDLPQTEREKYVAENERRLALPDEHPEKIYADRTPGWFRQRKGNITASAVTGISNKGGERTTNALVKKLVNDVPIPMNIDMAEGAANEVKAIRRLQQRHGLIDNGDGSKSQGLFVEEAYFDTNPNIPGFGASPDGIIFDAEGNRLGPLEVKYHKGKSGFDKGLEHYNNQRQIQMAITGDSKMFFYQEIAGKPDEGKLTIVEADPEIQNNLISSGFAAQEIVKKAKEAGLNIDEIKAQLGKTDKGEAAKEEATAFKVKDEKGDPIVPFRPDGVKKDASERQRISWAAVQLSQQIKDKEKEDRAEERARKLELIAGAKAIEAYNKKKLEEDDKREAKVNKAHEEAIAEDDKREARAEAKVNKAHEEAIAEDNQRSRTKGLLADREEALAGGNDAKVKAIDGILAKQRVNNLQGIDKDLEKDKQSLSKADEVNEAEKKSLMQEDLKATRRKIEANNEAAKSTSKFSSNLKKATSRMMNIGGQIGSLGSTVMRENIEEIVASENAGYFPSEFRDLKVGMSVLSGIDADITGHSLESVGKFSSFISNDINFSEVASDMISRLNTDHINFDLNKARTASRRELLGMVADATQGDPIKISKLSRILGADLSAFTGMQIESGDITGIESTGSDPLSAELANSGKIKLSTSVTNVAREVAYGLGGEALYGLKLLTEGKVAAAAKGAALVKTKADEKGVDLTSPKDVLEYLYDSVIHTEPKTEADKDLGVNVNVEIDHKVDRVSAVTTDGDEVVSTYSEEFHTV